MALVFDILTLFPDLCRTYCESSILGRAREKGLIDVRTVDIRDFAHDRHRTVDDSPYGGGDGMVMMAGPVLEALESLPTEPKGRVLLLSPRGRAFDQKMALELAGESRLTLICGRYEGIDERVSLLAGPEEVSLGDFVLTGGELAALCVVDAVARLIPGVLGGSDSAEADSFMDGLLEHPHYTRPAEFRGLSVPEVLLGGNHRAIADWRRKESLRKTWLRRPDLLEDLEPDSRDRALLKQILAEEKGGGPGCA